MSVDPLKGASGEIHHPSGDITKAAAASASSERLPQLEALLERQISLSKTKREEYFGQLDLVSQEVIKAVEHFIQKLKDLFHKLKASHSDSQILLGEWEAIITSLKQYEKYGLKIFFLEVSQDVDLNMFEFYKEITRNSLFNRLKFHQEIKREITEHMGLIVHEFFPKAEKIDVTRIEYRIKIPENETHNQGKSVAFIDFFCEGQLKAQMVYKPRDAQIDQAVIKLFQDMNQLASSQILSYSLPYYKIVSLARSSFWEYISGPHIKKCRSAAVFISQQTMSEEQRKRQNEKLDRMDCILAGIHVSDLHPENLIVRKLESDDFEIVPIDLENIQNVSGKVTKTQLGGSPEKSPLLPEEQALIEGFNKKVDEIPYRFLVFSTDSLARMITDYKNGPKLAKMVKDQLVRDNFTLRVTEMQLLEKILVDMLNYDVPYIL